MSKALRFSVTTHSFMADTRVRLSVYVKSLLSQLCRFYRYWLAQTNIL